jgi:hypothetical protein
VGGSRKNIVPGLIVHFEGSKLRVLILRQTAVIKESLRLGHGVVGPLPRVVGPQDGFIAGVHVPRKVCQLSFGAKFVL